jgi:hypothetical protein
MTGDGHLMPGYTTVGDDGEEVLHWDFPSQEQINEQDTPFLRQCFKLHKRYKSCGTPHGLGYGNERQTVINIIVLLDQEEARYESWYMKNREHLEGDG